MGEPAGKEAGVQVRSIVNGALHGDSGLDSVGGKWDNGEAAVILAARPYDGAVIESYSVFHKSVMSDEGGVSVLWMALPEDCTSLKISKEESDSAGA